MKMGMEKTSRTLILTRLETCVTPGVPDVLICDEKGKFHFVELKATAGRAVDLRPHQVAWLSRHNKASVWVLVLKIKTKTKPQEVRLYPGNKAMDLKLTGMAVEPLYLGEGDKIDWETILCLICPI
jgi:hypothetical protein